MSDPVMILDFWLNEIGPKGWYVADEAVDAVIAARFGEAQAAASAGHLEHWVDGPSGTLAYLILTDQFSRNLFRGQAEAFACDSRARDAARRAVTEGWDLEVPEPARQFFYLPFEHSEDMADQNFAVELFETRMTPSEGEGDAALHARVHRSIIKRFGRFPFRNAALGRKTTADEQAFIDEGGYGAAVRALQSHAPDA